jgi:hypothetical protein
LWRVSWDSISQIICLRLELRAFTLSHSTSPFFLWRVFLRLGLSNYLPGAWTQGLYLKLLHQPFFLWRVFFEIKSLKLFAWAGFKLWSCWPLPSE